MRKKLSVYTTKAWRISALLTTGVFRPLICPGVSMETPGLLARLSADLVYIRLHGLPDQSYLYGDPNWETALGFEQVRDAPPELFTGSLVFLEGCFGGRISSAFLDAGARAVVGSKITTWGHPTRLGPSSVIGKTWIKSMKDGDTVGAALHKALRRVDRKFTEYWQVYGKKEAQL